MNMHEQKARPIGREQIQKEALALSVRRKSTVNETRPSFYSMIVKHGFKIYERAQLQKHYNQLTTILASSVSRFLNP